MKRRESKTKTVSNYLTQPVGESYPSYTHTRALQRMANKGGGDNDYNRHHMSNIVRGVPNHRPKGWQDWKHKYRLNDYQQGKSQLTDNNNGDPKQISSTIVTFINVPAQQDAIIHLNDSHIPTVFPPPPSSLQQEQRERMPLVVDVASFYRIYAALIGIILLFSLIFYATLQTKLVLQCAAVLVIPLLAWIAICQCLRRQIERYSMQYLRL